MFSSERKGASPFLSSSKLQITRQFVPHCLVISSDNSVVRAMKIAARPASWPHYYFHCLFFFGSFFFSREKERTGRSPPKETNLLVDVGGLRPPFTGKMRKTKGNWPQIREFPKMKKGGKNKCLFSKNILKNSKWAHFPQKLIGEIYQKWGNQGVPYVLLKFPFQTVFKPIFPKEMGILILKSTNFLKWKLK